MISLKIHFDEITILLSTNILYFRPKLAPKVCQSLTVFQIPPHFITVSLARQSGSVMFKLLVMNSMWMGKLVNNMTKWLLSKYLKPSYSSVAASLVLGPFRVKV